jgi:hypothetical protein
MEETIKYTGLMIIVLTLISSCSKDYVTDDFNSDFYSIISVSVDGKTREKFLYNNAGKIIEYQSSFFCQKFIYGDNNRVIKQDMKMFPELKRYRLPKLRMNIMTKVFL